MTSAARAPKNIYDFLLGRYQWIQQESVFWRRRLWESAGAAIDQSFQFMVDGELWSRFFLLDDLYSVDCVLSGYRVHSMNRAGSNYAACVAEMERAIATMKPKCASDVRTTTSRLHALKGMHEVPLIGCLPLAKLARRALPSTFDKASYKNLFFEDGVWKERRLPYSPFAA